MGFNLNAVLDSAKSYHTSEYKGSEPLASFSEICAILKKFKEEIFDSFCNMDLYNSIKSNVSAPISSSMEEVKAFQNTALQIHQVAFNSLFSNQKPNENDYKKIQEIFNAFISSLDDGNELKSDIVKITQAPKVVMKTSEEFMKYCSKTLGCNDFDYMPDSFLAKCEELHKNDQKLCGAIKKWIASFCKVENMKDLKSAYRKPYFVNKNANAACESLTNYILNRVHMAETSASCIQDSEVEAIQILFKELFNYFEDLQTGFLLFSKKNEIVQNIAQVHGDYQQIQEKIRTLELDLKQAKANLSEVEAVEKAHPSLCKDLEETKKIRQQAVTDLEHQINEEKKAHESLRTRLLEISKEGDQSLSLANQRSPVKEAVASEISDTTFEEIATLKDNVPLLILCLEDYYNFMNQKNSRDSVNQHSWLPFTFPWS